MKKKFLKYSLFIINIGINTFVTASQPQVRWHNPYAARPLSSPLVEVLPWTEDHKDEAAEDLFALFLHRTSAQAVTATSNQLPVTQSAFVHNTGMMNEEINSLEEQLRNTESQLKDAEARAARISYVEQLMEDLNRSNQGLEAENQRLKAENQRLKAEVNTCIAYFQSLQRNHALVIQLNQGLLYALWQAYQERVRLQSQYTRF